jgi:predicted nucleotidyltransferase
MSILQPIHRLLYRWSEGYRKASDEYGSDVNIVTAKARDLTRRMEFERAGIAEAREDIEQALSRRNQTRNPGTQP